MELSDITKLIKDNCYREKIETKRGDEIRWFMLDKDVKELAEELVKKMNVLKGAPSCQNCGNHYPHSLRDEGFSCDECGHKWS